MLKLATKFRPHSTAFETARRAGFRCVEFWLDPHVLEQWPRVSALAQQYPFRYALHFPNRTDLSSASLRQTVQLYRELDCTALVIHQPMYEKYAEFLLRLEPALELAVENHRLDESSLLRWAQESPGLTLDVEHLWKFTLEDCSLDDLVDAVDRLLVRHVEKLQHVHLPGYWAGSDEHRPMHHAQPMVVPVLSLLADYGFSKLIVSEANEAYQNLDDLSRDVQLYESWLSQRAVRN
jgi:sugar phosphate isomerase/epimerase